MFYRHGNGHWIFMIIVLIAIAAAVVWFISDRRSRPRHQALAPGVSAAELLDRRLVTGEIGVDEYERLRAVLRGGAGEAPAGTSG